MSRYLYIAAYSYVILVFVVFLVSFLLSIVVPVLSLILAVYAGMFLFFQPLAIIIIIYAISKINKSFWIQTLKYVFVILLVINIFDLTNNFLPETFHLVLPPIIFYGKLLLIVFLDAILVFYSVAHLKYELTNYEK